MPTIGQEFAELSAAFVEAFSDGAVGTLTRVSNGTYSAATGTEGVETTSTLSIAYVRHGDPRIEFRPTGAGEALKFEVVEYYIDAADLVGDLWPTGADAPPRIDDSFTEAASPNGDGKTRRITEVRLQVGGKGWKIRTETLLTN